jgi:hypothetical protein
VCLLFQALATQKKVQPASERLLMNARQRHLRELFDRWDTDEVRILSLSLWITS